MKKTMKNAMSSLTAKLAALLLAFTCAGTAWGATTPVSTLAELTAAITAASAGDTIQLTADITVNKAVVVDKSLTLDLSGKTLVLKYMDASQGSLTNTAPLTVVGGTVTSTGPSTAAGGTIYGITYESDLTLQNVSISAVSAVPNSTTVSPEGKVCAVYGKSGNLVVENCTLSATAKAKNQSNHAYAVYVESTAGAVSISGSSLTVSNTTVSNASYGKEFGLFLAADIVPSIADSTIQGIMIASTNTRDITLNAGIFANNTLTGFTHGIDYSGTGSLTVDGITVNAGTFSGSTGIYNRGTGTVVVKTGSTVASTQSDAIYNASTGKIVVDGGTISTTYSTMAGVKNYGKGEVVINGGTISGGYGVYNNTGTTTINNGTISGTMSTGAVFNNGAGTVNIAGGTIENTGTSANCSAVYNNGTGKINITGGSMTGSKYGVYNNGSGTVTIEDGTIAGQAQSGVYNRVAGKVAVTEGTITGKTDGVYNYGTGSITIEGGAISGETNGIHNYNAKGSVAVSGGTVSGAINDNNKTGTVTVSGGTFTTDVSSYLADGSTQTDNGNGTYTIAPPAAQIGETKYKTLAEALTAAKAAGMTEVEVVLLDDAQFSTITSLVGSFSKITFKGTARNQTLDINLNSAFDVRPSTEFVFDGLTVSRLDTSSDAWLYHYFSANKITYNDCKLVGEFTVMHQDTDFVNCAFTVPESYGKHYALWVCKCDNRTVNVSGCTFAGYDRAIKMYGDGFSSTMTLNISDSQLAISKKNKTVVEIAVDKGNKGTFNLVINNCTKTNFGTSEHVGAKWGENLVSEWFNAEIKSEVVANGDTFNVYVDGERIFMPCAKVGEASYCDLQKAVDAAEAGGTVELIGNVTLVSDLVVNKTLTITTGGYAIIGNVTASENYVVVKTETGYQIGIPVAKVEKDGSTMHYFDLHEALEAGKAAGSVVTLLADVDLNNEPWTPVGKYVVWVDEQGNKILTSQGKEQADPAYYFAGTFDGNGKKISNLKINKPTMTSVGLIGYGHGSPTVKNLTVENVDVKGRAAVGSVFGDGINNVQIDNVTVTGKIAIEGNYKVGGIIGGGYFCVKNSQVVGDGTGTITGVYLGEKGDVVGGETFAIGYEGDNVGGIAGFAGEGNSLRFQNCSVSGVKIVGTRKVGGVAGSLYQSNKAEKVSVSDITVGTNADTDYATANLKTMGIGSLVGVYTAHAENNGELTGSVSGVTTVNENKIDESLYTIGVITGGLRGDNTLPVHPASTLDSDVQLTLTSTAGFSNDYLVPVATLFDVDGTTAIRSYTTLAAAVEAATTGQTVKLLTDNAEDITVSTAKTFTIDADSFTYSGNVTAASGYVLSATTSGTTTTYAAAVAIARIGSTEYGSLDTLLAAIPSDGTPTTITILVDLPTGSTYITLPQGYNVTIDFNGHVITSTLSGAYAPIENYGTLTLVDTSAGKTGGIAGVNRCVNNYGTLNVGTGTFDSGTKTASNVVFGGNYTTTSHSGGTAIRGANASAVMNIWDCNVDAGMYAVYNYGTANVYGGTFNGTSCSKCTGSSYAYTFSSAGTLNFYNGAVSGVHGALSVVNGTASIYDGTFTVVSCQRLVGHSETPNAGNYYALYVAGETGAVSCDVLGGTFTSPGVSVVLNGNSGDGGLKEHATLAIHGGTFVATGSSTTVFQNDNVLGDPKIYAGTFTAATAEKIAAFYESATSKGYLGDDYRLSELDAATHTYTVESRGVAKIERTGEATQYYSTLAAAFGAAQTDDTILLLADVEQTSPITPLNSKRILDLNGYEIDGNGNTSIFNLNNGGILEIDDSRGGGKICNAVKVIQINGAYQDNLTVGGEVILKAGSIEGCLNRESYGIYSNNGHTKVEIQGGSVYGGYIAIRIVKADKVGAGYVKVSGGQVKGGFDGYVHAASGIEATVPITIEGGKIVAESKNQTYAVKSSTKTLGGNELIKITGGTLCSYTPGIGASLSIDSQYTTEISGGWFSEKVTASSATAVPDEYCAEDYLPSEETKNDFGDGLTYHTVKLGVAKIGTKAYDSLAEAFAAAEDGDTVKLLKDVELTDRLFVNAGATPAYAGSNNRYATTSENKAVTLDLNGKNITSDSNIALAGGSLNVTGTGKISTTNDGLAPIEVRGTGDLATKRTLTIGSGVTLEGGEYGLNVFGSNDAQKNVIDVTVDGTVNGTLFVLGNLKNAANEINIVVNGTVAAPAGEGDNVNVGIALNGNANVTVNNGATVSGDSGIEVRAGTLTVNGGTITAKAETYSYKANGSGSTTKGAAISVAQHTTVLPTAVTLNGGTLVGTEKVYVKEVNAGMPDVTVQATQGYTATATIPEDFKWVETATAGVYTLAVKDYVAQIVRNDTVVCKYESLADAIAQAQADDTIALLADVNSDTRFSITKSLTIDGQGHTIAVNNHDNRVIDISETSDVTLTLKNVTIDGDNVKVDDAYPRGISMYGNTNVKLVLDNATVSAGHYAINVAGANNGVQIDIKNSSVASGWAAINVWSPAEINVTGSELSGSNDKGFEANGWNNFSTIVLNEQGDTSAAGSELTFTNTKIKSEVQTGNSQWFVDVRCGDATITFDNCEFEQTGTPADDGKHPDAMFAVRGAEVSDVTFDDCTFTKDGVEVDAVDALVQNTLFYSYPALYSDYVIDQTQYVIGTDGEVRQAVPGTVERDEDYNVTAGTFYDENDPTDTLADGYIADKNADGTYTVRVAHYVAQVFTGETAGQKYESLDEALKAAADGDTVKLLQDIELTDRLFVNAGTTPTLDSKNRYATTSENKSITLDLNGFDITSASNIALAGGSLTITGKGTISTTGSGLAPIEVRGTGDLASKRTLTIGEDVTLDSTSRSYGLNVFGSNDAQKNIIDVTVDGTVNGTVFVLGNLTNADNEINIVVNGTVVAPNNAAADKSNVGIAINGNANVTVNDGAAVSGDTGVEVRAGALTVNGGTITGTAETYSYKANGSGSTTKGAAVAVAQHTTRQPISVEVKGGTLAGPASVAVVDPENGDPAGVSVALKGGTFSGTVEIDESAASVGSIIPGEVGDGANPALFSDAASDGVAEDYKLVAVEPATDPVMYHVIPKDYVAQVGEGDGAKKYETLAEAVKAVPTDGTATTVKLLKAVSGETIAVNGSRNVVLDLDGKELTPDFLYVLNGALEARNGTIKNRVYVYGLDTDNSGMSSTFTLAQGATITAQYGVILNNMTTESPAYDATVNVAGTINGNIWVMGNIQEGDSVINVSGTVAASGVAIALNGVATLNVTGGTVTGTTGIEARAGTLNVTGGTIKETATGLTVKANGSGTTVTGAAVAISQHTTEKPVTVNISGGTLDATAGGVALYEVDTVASETPSAGVTATVTGGTFYGSVTNENGTITIPALVDGNPNPAHFSEQEKTQGVPADYKLVPVEGTSDPVMYQIVAKDYVVKAVDGEGNILAQYESLQEAFDNAPEGSTLQPLDNLVLTEMAIVKKGRTVSLDLAGKSITASPTTWTAGDCVLCVNYGGSLTVSDSSNPSTAAIDATTGNTAKVYGAVKVTNKGEIRSGDEVAALTVDGGTLVGYYYGIVGNGGRPGTEITVNGGEVKATCPGDNLAIFHPQSGTLTLNGGKLTGATGVEMRAGELVVPADSTVEVTADGTYSATANGSGSTIVGSALALSQHVANPSLSATVAGGTFRATGTDGKAFVEVDLQNEDVTGISATLAGGTFYGVVSTENVETLIPGTSTALFSDAASDGVAEDYKLVAVEPATDPVMYHVIPKDYVAQVGEGDGAKKYETLAEAVKAVPTDGTATTVKLLKAVSGETIAVNGSRNVVLDLDGKELTPDFLYVLNGALEARNGTIKNRVYVYGLDTDNSGMSSTFTLAQGATITAQYGVILNNMTTESPAYDATVNVAGTINGNIWVMGNIQEGDSVINVSGTVAASGVAIALNGVATLNVTGGTVTGTTGIEARAGTLNVTGGTIKETATGLTVKANGSGTTVTGAAVAISQHTTEKPVTVNISGGTLDATAGGVALYEVDTVASETPSAGVTATVTGGTFYGSVTNENGTITIPALVDGNPNPAHFSEQEKTQGVPADYKLVPVDGTSDPVMYQIVPKDYVAQVVREEAVVGKYESLAEAFAAAEDGDTVQLIADAELDDSLDVASDGAVITLDLNGKELSAAEGKVANDKFTANSAHDYLIGVKYGTTLQIVDSVGGGAIDGSKLIVAVKLTTKGETPANEDDSAALVVGSEDDADLNNFTISGDYYGISGNGTRHQTNLAVHGGTIQAVNDSEGTGIYQPQDGILYIGGGTIKGFDSAVEVRAGDATFWGGNYVVTGPTTYSATSNGNGTTIKGAAIAIDPHATGKELSVTVLDEGPYSFTVPQGGVRFAIANAENVDIDSLLSVQVTGLAEVFGQSFELPEGYDWYLVGEDVYTIKRTVAERLDANGGHVAYYATLEDAMDAVEDGETVKLLKDVELTDRLFVNAGATPAYAGSNNRYATTSENKAVTLDLNGKNITSDSNIALAGGSLNITGTGKISTTNDGLAPIEVRGTGDLANKRTLTIGSGVTLEGAEYGLNVFGSNDAQKNLIDVTVNGTVNGTIFVLGNLKNAENEINIVVNGTVTASAGSAEDVTVGIALNGNANVTVNDGAEVTGETGIEVRAGTLTVNGGKITGTASEYSYNPNGSGCTTKGAAVAVAQHGTKLATSVTLNGGTFEGVKTIGVTDVNGNMDNVEVLAKQGFTENSAIPDDYKWVETETSGVYELVPKDYVAQIGDDGEKFETLAEAFAAAQSGDTVKLLKDIELTDRLFVNAGATPAYAGKNNRYATTSENKAVTLDLNDHDITGSSNIALAGGSLTITGSGTISTTTSGLAPIEVRGTGSLTSKRTLTIDTGVTLEGKCYGVNVFGSNSADKNVIDVNVNGTVRGMVFVLGNLTNSANEININVTGTVDASAAVGEESVHTAIAQCGYSTVTVSDGAVVKGESGIETRAGTLTVNGGTITATAAYNYASNGSGTTTKGAAVAVAQYGADRVTSVTINNGTLSGEKKIAVTDVNNDMSKVKVFAKEADTTPTVIPEGYSWAESTEKPGMWTLVKQLASFTYPIEGTAGIPVDLQWLEDNLDGVKLPILETQTDDIIAALSEKGENGIPVWQSYVLGLNPKSATSQLRLAATAKDATTVTITGIIDTTKFPKIANVTVIFRLASRNADGTWSNIDGCTGAASPSFDMALDAVAGKTLAIFADIVTE